MRTFTKLTCAALAGAALFGVSGFSSVANAAPAEPLAVSAPVNGDEEMSTASTRAFWIQNRTAERMTLVRVAGVGGDLLPEDSWPDNPVLEPGQTMRIEVTSGFFGKGHEIEVRLQGDKVRWIPARDVPAYYPGPEGMCSDRGGPVEDCHAYTIPAQPYLGEAAVLLNVWGQTRTSDVTRSSFGPAQAGGEAIVLNEGAGTMTVPASNPTAQTGALGLCGAEGTTCTFLPTGQVETNSAPHQVSSIPKIVNDSTAPITKELSIDETATALDNISANDPIKKSIMTTVGTSVKSVGMTWTDSREFADSKTVTVAPNHAGWVESELSILRTTGDFIIRNGDTTWILEGMSFDSPDPHRTPNYSFMTEELGQS